MDPPGGLGDRHPLDAVDPALELQVRPHPLLGGDRSTRVDGDAHVLVAAQLGVGGGEDLGGPAHALGVAGVHAGQVPGEQGRLLAALAGLDLDDDVTGVVRVARDEHVVEPGGGPFLLLDQAGHLGGEDGGVLVPIRSELDGVGQVRVHGLPGAVGGHHPPELGVAATQAAQGGGVGRSRPGHLRLDGGVLVQSGSGGGEVAVRQVLGTGGEDAVTRLGHGVTGLLGCGRLWVGQVGGPAGRPGPAQDGGRVAWRRRARWRAVTARTRNSPDPRGRGTTTPAAGP